MADADKPEEQPSQPVERDPERPPAAEAPATPATPASETPGTPVSDAGTSTSPSAGAEETTKARRTVGIILIVLGIWFFLDQFFNLVVWAEMWPLLLIIIGLLLLIRR
ncbi:MAG: hypothetical protein Kow00129_06090 [Thermoleophilia bacterium]